MAVYMVERKLPGVTLEQLGAAQKAAIETASKFSAQGDSIKYIRTAYVPEEERCMCLFEAESSDKVEELNNVAQIPYDRVIEAIDLSP